MGRVNGFFHSQHYHLGRNKIQTQNICVSRLLINLINYEFMISQAVIDRLLVYGNGLLFLYN